ncbi:MAG: FkbM family methyltransferase [Burkholderiales bacterium]|nr:FkbM family methyltransferase [Burkholderiales bacterium]
MQSIVSLLPALPTIRIVDVGAMDVGDTPYAPLLAAVPCEVIGFEPVEEECRKLNDAGQAGRRFLPYVIGDGSEQTFHECAYAYNSSLLEPNFGLLRWFTDFERLFAVMATKPVQTRRLDDIAEVAGADFLKMDVQGGELLVLRGAERFLRDILVVHTEACFSPLYRGQPLFADLDSHLRARGFFFHRFGYFGGYPFRPIPVSDGSPSLTNQPLWCDAIYVRDFQGFDLLAPAQLLKLAAILHENYASPGLAAVALAEFDRKTGSALQPRYLDAIGIA